MAPDGGGIVSTGKPREAASSRRDIHDLRSDRIKKFRAVKTRDKKAAKERDLAKRVGQVGIDRLTEFSEFMSRAKAAIKADPDLGDLDVQVYKHVNRDGTIDIELRINDLPSYQSPDVALMILSEALPDSVGNGDVFISHGARFAIEAPESEYDPETGEEIIRSLEDLKARYGKHKGRVMEQTYWRDASKAAKKVGSLEGSRRMVGAFVDRDRKVDTVYVRYHWSPTKERP
jgi:hypothetical protein